MHGLRIWRLCALYEQDVRPCAGGCQGRLHSCSPEAIHSQRGLFPQLLFIENHRPAALLLPGSAQCIQLASERTFDIGTDGLCARTIPQVTPVSPDISINDPQTLR